LTCNLTIDFHRSTNFGRPDEPTLIYNGKKYAELNEKSLKSYYTRDTLFFKVIGISLLQLTQMLNNVTPNMIKVSNF
jgi:hypothetical protein